MRRAIATMDGQFWAKTATFVGGVILLRFNLERHLGSVTEPEDRQ